MNDKKLVRGLKDISPLFRETSGAVPTQRSLEVQVIGVSSPDCEGDSLFLNTLFASKIVSQNKPCSILSVQARCSRASLPEMKIDHEALGSSLDRYCLYWDEFRDLFTGPLLHKSEGALQSRDIFLDFEYRHLFHFERALTLLDKWVLVLKPTAESLTEGYKMMKMGVALNPKLEFYIAMSGTISEAKAAVFHDRFSDFAARHLNAQLGWLGWLDLADSDGHFSASLYTDLLKYQEWHESSNLQKFMLAGWVESLEKEKRTGLLAEVLL